MPNVRTSDPFPSTRLSLLGRLGQDLPEDWKTFFSIYGPLVFRMARQAGLPDCDADEIVSTVMRGLLSAVRNGFHVDHERGKFRQYLRTASNNAIRAMRRERRLGATAELCEDVRDQAAPPGPSWERVEKLERVRACLERLRASPVLRRRDFEAFEAVVFGGEAPRTVAKRLQITVERVYSIKHEVLKHLRGIRSELDEQFGEV